MLSFESRADIAASPHRVWETLLDTGRWPEWDAALDRVEGRLEPGGQISIHVKGVKRPFTPKVITWEPGRQLVLRSGMPLGLFKGVRTYRFEGGYDRCRFQMTERFSGPLAPLITRSIPDLQPSFDSFVAGLRAATESEANRKP